MSNKRLKKVSASKNQTLNAGTKITEPATQGKLKMDPAPGPHPREAKK